MRPTAPTGPPALLPVLAFLPPAVAAVVLALRTPPEASWFLVGLTSAAVLTGVPLARRHARRSERGRVLVALCTASFLFLWPELGLRLAGRRFDSAGVIQFGYPRPSELVELQHDPELFWRLPADDPEVNAHGFVGDDFVVPKPPDVLRLVFLGDSCTQQGYPEMVERRLNGTPELVARAQAARFEALNLGVSGYSSHQGRIVAEQWLAELEPDVVLVYFGWNDHWRAWGATDAGKAQAAPPALVAGLAGRSRLVGWVLALGRAAPNAPLEEPRVPLADYRANLRTIGRLAREVGAQVVLITAPSAHDRRGVPAYLITEGFAGSSGEARELHKLYNAAAREVAAEDGWLVVDAEREAAKSGDVEELFLDDGIHFQRRGLAWLADLLVAFLAERLPGPR